MRRPWIKVETATPDKPEICTIAASLRLSEDAVLGKLIRLWSWVEINHIQANDMGVTKEFLDKLVGRKGFAAALADCGWLVEEDGKLGLKNLERHNGGSAKVRALTAHRVALHRKRKSNSVINALQTASSINEKIEIGATDFNAENNVLNGDITLEFKEPGNLTSLQSSSVDATTNHSIPVNVSTEIYSAQDEVNSLKTEECVEVAAKEPAPPKRRLKAADASPEQPLLF